MGYTLAQYLSKDGHDITVLDRSQAALNKASETLARMMQERFRELLQPDNDREIKLCGKELFLCYYSENPTIMAECGFMSNPDEAALLNTGEYRGKVAFTLFAGINDFVNRKK